MPLEHKADFTDDYLQPDPRAYVRAMHALDYDMARRAGPLVAAVLDAAAGEGAPPDVLDLCCSYGFNAAQLRCGLGMAAFSRRYADLSSQDLDSARLIASDRTFFGERGTPSTRVLGLDCSAPAIAYATAVGLLDDGWSQDLETADPSPELVAGVQGVGLVICTGGVGYVGPATFERLVRALPAPASVWVLSFVLRSVPYGGVARALEPYGLVTERVPGLTYRQRRFVDGTEQSAALADLRAHGLDPEGRETSGYYHAEAWMTRPLAAAALPVADLLSQVS